MNWTGGTLQRTKKANQGITQKQKAHFARARTQLQQSPGALATQFRPEYLHHGNGRTQGHRLSPFGRDSVSDTGRSARKKYCNIDEHDTSPTAHRSQHRDDQRQSEEPSPRFAQGKRQKKEDKWTDADAELQLLEANKKRSLGQQDWVRVAPSRPVDLQFLSIKEKSQIGKRRKIDRNRRRSPTTFPRRVGQDALEDHEGAFVSGALPILTTANTIRVRIGSAALTTAASTQPNDDARSQTHSDSMLFDEEGIDAARRVESEAPPTVTLPGHTLAVIPRSTVEQPAKYEQDCSPKFGESARHGLCARSDTFMNTRIRHTRAASNTPDQSVHRSEATDPSYHLTHRMGGTECPLKLVFSRSTRKLSHTMPPTDQSGETQRVHADFNAEDSELVDASRNIDEDDQSSVRRPPRPQAIIDDEPWKLYVDTGTSSSGQVCIDDGTAMSVPQPHISARNTRADRTDRPQHIAHGNLTHLNLSTVPANLPTPRRPRQRLPDARPFPRTDTVQHTGHGEKFWRTAALGSDPHSAIDTIHSPSGTSEDSMSQATKGYASTRLPLSAAVTSVSSTPFPSTPFRSLSGQASRISDDVQYASHSGSWSITSAAPSHTGCGRIVSLVEQAPQGEDDPAPSRFGEQSVHASLQNHASLGSDMFGDTRTSRSALDRCGRTWDDVSRQAQASGSASWHQGRGSSTWDSDSAGIDLVDVDRLT